MINKWSFLLAATWVVLIASPNTYAMQKIVSGSLGVAFYNSGKSTQFDSGFSNYDYHSKHNSMSSFVFGVFAGLENCLCGNWRGQFGLAYYDNSKVKINGILTQGVDLQSADKYPYHYSIQSQQFLCEGKLLYNWSPCVHPYLAAGLGWAANRASKYRVDYPSCYAFTPLFEGKSRNQFAFDLGLGVDFDLSRCLRLGLGYRYANLGSAQLGAGVIDNVAIPNKLHRNNLNAQELLAQLGVLF